MPASETLATRDLLALLLSPEARRHLALRDKPNAELFELYCSELVLHLNSEKNIRDHELTLAKFRDYLGEYPPSPELAKQFLVGFQDLKPRTRYRYTHMVKGFMKWYGQPLDDVKVKIPKSLPPYVEKEAVEKLLQSVDDKRGYQHLVARDKLIIKLAYRAGLRRSEIANLKARDVHADALFIRNSKGQKDRLVPLTADVAQELNGFIAGKAPEDRVIGLGGPHITMRIKYFARRAGLPADFHIHSLRHKYATDLLEAGANIRAVQELMGHENLNTTEVYLGITNEGLREAVNKLDHTKSVDQGRQEVNLELTAAPAAYNPLNSTAEPPPIATAFSCEIGSASIFLESVQLRTSDPELPFSLMLFERPPNQAHFDLEQEDIVQMEPVTQRTYTYQPHRPLKYVNQAGESTLMGAIVVYRRPIPIALLSEAHEAELVEHMARPSQFSVTIQYQTRHYMIRSTL